MNVIFPFFRNSKSVITEIMCHLLQIISAVTGGITDLSFDATGYTWQILNCILTAGYSVCLEHLFTIQSIHDVDFLDL